MAQFIIRPKWQPFETAPKDRPIWAWGQSADFRTGEIREYQTQIYWGIMRAYPDHGKMWIPLGEDDNSSYQEDTEFKRVTRVYEDHGQIRTLVHYRGFRTTHWADIINHTVKVAEPDGNYHNKPHFVDTDRD